MRLGRLKIWIMDNPEKRKGSRATLLGRFGGGWWFKLGVDVSHGFKEGCVFLIWFGFRWRIEKEVSSDHQDSELGSKSSQ